MPAEEHSQKPREKPAEMSEGGDDEGLHIEVDRDQLEPLVSRSLSAHRWIQKGPYLVCQSCPLEHATYIGTGLLFYGTDDQGKPILKKIGTR